ncbi:hypothetical protein WK92_11145 [Burkholderia ubonensis]|uniref:PoNe immunity protein domain-containing protein n=1 Tax=Burkholderia ubonensis TaxID=101571 RepID=UPI0007586E02|nr:PoNe immunity protein domain-containing protein [Burkholderia ubonensis]KVV59324.1 hypothetical protein WK82_26600 [Burkholderia ubonensis]KVW23613.1 hypothetical protein WK92_11145 [Burkholderia ubonensis]
MNDFSSRRRQRFISEAYYDFWSSYHREALVWWSTQLPKNGTENEKQAVAAARRAESRFELMLLRYTAGEPIVELREELGDVVAAYEEYAQRQAAVHRLGWPPLRLSELEDYERTVQLIGLGHLLHRRDLLARIAAMEDPFYVGEDGLYEDLLAYAIKGRIDVDTCIHDSYLDCLNSIYGEDDDERRTDMNAYLDQWYASMSDVPWHDSHLNLSNEWGLYFGYWAIEAAALSYILELDDTSLRKHIVYPKALVDFARTFKESTQSTTVSVAPATVRTGQICPETGIWKAQGHHVPGVMVQQGERMPDVFAPDKSGAFRPQPALWEFERKA